MNEMREQWLYHGISDIDYIRYLEKQINALQEHKMCDGCEFDDEFKELTLRCLGCTRRDRKDYYILKSTE